MNFKWTKVDLISPQMEEIKQRLRYKGMDPTAEVEEDQRQLQNLSKDTEVNDVQLAEFSIKIDMEWDTMESAWKYYGEHAKKYGFEVRKEYFSKSRIDGKLCSQCFVCTKAGVRKEDKRRKTDSHKAQTKTNCPAKLAVSLNRQKNKWVVYRYVEEHNHETVPSEMRYLMKSNRTITESLTPTPYVRFDQCPILLQASKEFTPNIFKIFENEYNKALGSRFVERSYSDNHHTYVVQSFGKQTDSGRVCYDPLVNTVSCSCMNFERVGILCFHAIKVFIMNDVMEIPSKYMCASVHYEEYNRNNEERNVAIQWHRACDIRCSRIASQIQWDCETREEFDKVLEWFENRVYERTVEAGKGCSKPVENNIIHEIANLSCLKKQEGKVGKKRMKSLHEKWTKKNKKKNCDDLGGLQDEIISQGEYSQAEN